MEHTAGNQLQRPMTYLMSAGCQSSSASDCVLARAAAEGVMAGIGVLYERHSRRVYSLCLRMTGNKAEAEDLTQEVFIQLMHKIGSFRGESKFTTWLHRLAVNQVLMHFRRTKSRQEHMPAGIDIEQLTRIPLPELSSPLVERTVLDAALTQLPAGCRAVFLKFDVEGYRHEEIARLFGCSVGNSKSQLHKARRKLRRLLNRERAVRKSSQSRLVGNGPLRMETVFPRAAGPGTE
jgi:RNA polymerase sigma-70 factor, ECF subfamily